MTMQSLISEAEKSYICAGCRCNIRSDGRELLDFRTVSVESDIFPHVNGSSRVRIGGNAVDIICSVKLEISEPLKSMPNAGILDIGVDYSPSCNLKIDERKLTEQGALVAETLKCILSTSKCIDLNSLCILNGKYCWIIHIDLLILQADGNTLDYCSLATNIALQCTRIPRIQLLEGESGLPEDFELCSGDFADSDLLQVTDIPLCVTVTKIDGCFLLDCGGYEAACSSSSIVVAVDRRERCCGLKKLSGGAITVEELCDCIPIAVRIALSIFPKIDRLFALTAAEDSQYPDAPPLRKGFLI